MRDMSIEDIWKDRPAEFYLSTENAIRTFAGIAESTMYRDESWHFLQLGRFVERTQLLADLIDTQLATFPAGEHAPESDWLSLPANLRGTGRVRPSVFPSGPAIPCGSFPSDRSAAALSLDPFRPRDDLGRPQRDFSGSTAYRRGGTADRSDAGQNRLRMAEP